MFILSSLPLVSGENTPETIYVSADGNDHNDGLTIDKPKKTIKNALNHVKEGGTIYVQNGVYKETLIVSKNVRLIGEGSNTTIIDGNRKHSCIHIKPGHKVLIEGLTITRGEAWINGGGICNDGSEVTIKNCLITNNRAYLSFVSTGGGICNIYGRIVIENSTIQNNGPVGWGGGIGSCTGVLVIRDSIIQNNSCNEAGGGLRVGGGCVAIENSLIQNNFAEYGGGISTENADVTIKNCIFQDNTVSKLGGDIHSDFHRVHLDNTQFIHNNTLVEPDIW